MDVIERGRISTARSLVMSYPGYSDETRAAWMDALDEYQKVRETSFRNAHDALEEAFKQYQPKRIK